MPNPRHLVVLLVVLTAALHGQTDWPVYGHDPGGRRYSPLTQITPQNIAKLQLAWKYTTGEGDGSPAQAPAKAVAAAQDHGPARTGSRRRSTQVTPLVIGNVMYLTTAYDRAVALEPETGKELWKFETGSFGTPALRGLVYWPGDARSPATVFFGTGPGYLVALNAKTGRPIPGFGNEGAVNLRAGIADRFPRAPYGLSSPPVIYKDLVITGSHVQEGPSLGPAGDVRAWDVHTGELVWTFHTVPRAGEAGVETWEGQSWKDRSGANVWGMMTVDADRGMVFLPLGCVTADYYGGDRKGANLYGDTLVALDAATGKLKWHFQTTHHDVWDYDLEAAPALIDIDRNGKKVPAVAQMTKQGLLFLFDRLTGKPIYGVEERPTPQAGFMPGEVPWPTQPFPVKPPALARNSFQAGDIAKLTPEHQKYCTDLLQSEGGIQTGGPYIPHGEKRSMIFPGTLGGGNWHGTSFDPRLGYLFVNVQNLGEIYRLREGSDPPVFIRSKFWDPETSWPCQQPPWGELLAVNVNTGDVAWRVALGTFDELEEKGLRTGTPNIGGSIATAGGVVFVGGTIDDRFRAFDSRTGKELWVTNVGAAAHTVPITYQGRNGKQYVAAMVSGGGFLEDHAIPGTLMVFSLP